MQRQASPSGGVNVDDVPANLNAEEFVVPRDVARWKGEEFFHKMIDQSRKARMTAAQSVGPTAGPPQAPGQQPTFTSQSFRGGSQQRFAAGGTTSTNSMGSWGAAGGYNGAPPVTTPKTGGYDPTIEPSTLPINTNTGGDAPSSYTGPSPTMTIPGYGQPSQPLAPNVQIPGTPGNYTLARGGSISARHRLRDLQMDEFLNQRAAR